MRDIATVTLADLIDRYQVFFIDQFGVLRDDEGAYDGAAAALAALKAAGKTVVILSNSGRSGDYNATRLTALGFDRASFDHFVTSGDVAFAVLSQRGSKVSAGSRCLTISSGGDRNLADRLGLTIVDDANAADLVIISGSEAERVPMSTYREILRPAAQRDLPCFCTNPDIHKLANGTTAPGAGSIARLYEELGGSVRWLGKPHREIYDHARAMIGNPEPAKIVCIGDSLDHDIAGAHGAGLASVLVGTGILSTKTLAERMAMMKSAGIWPTQLMDSFTP